MIRIVYKFLGDKNLCVFPPPWGNSGAVYSERFQAQARVHPRRTVSGIAKEPAKGILW